MYSSWKRLVRSLFQATWLLAATLLLIASCQTRVSNRFEEALSELSRRGAEVAVNHEDDVTAITLVGFDLTDADLDDWTLRLKGLDSLEALDAKGATISDAAVKHLQRLPRLKILGLADTGITNSKINMIRLFFNQTKNKTLLRKFNGIIEQV